MCVCVCVCEVRGGGGGKRILIGCGFFGMDLRLN